MEVKICSKCKVEKPKTKFYKRGDRPCGVSSFCKDCFYETMHKRYTPKRNFYSIEGEEWAMVGNTHMVSNHSRIMSIGRGIVRGNREHRFGDLLCIQTLDGDGYPCVNINNKKVNVHRLVALNFIANPHNKATVNHKDGDKTNNHISNLEWATYAENNQHAWDTGLKKRKSTWSK